MPQTITLTLTPKEAADAKRYTALAARRMGVAGSDVDLVRVVRRSIDARRGQPRVLLTLEVYADREPQPAPVHFDYPQVGGPHGGDRRRIGAGGPFCGAPPDRAGAAAVVLERGKEVARP